MNYVKSPSRRIAGMKSRKELNVEATRSALLSVARKHFAHDGYSDTEIGQIAADARVTTGAIYHHFSSKQGLFLAGAAGVLASGLAPIAARAQVVSKPVRRPDRYEDIDPDHWWRAPVDRSDVIFEHLKILHAFIFRDE